VVIWARCVSENLRKIALCALLLAKMAPEMKKQTFFPWRSRFYLVLSRQVRAIWASLSEIRATMVLEVPWFETMREMKYSMKWNEVVFSLEVIFFGVFFRASVGKVGQKSFASPKICRLLHRCAIIICFLLYMLWFLLGELCTIFVRNILYLFCWNFCRTIRVRHSVFFL